MPRKTLNYWKCFLASPAAPHAPPPYTFDDDADDLILADNNLDAVPDAVRTMRSLSMLDVGHNKLTSLPEWLGELTSLSQFLYVHDNALTSLPSSLSALTRLRYLNVAKNRLAGPLPSCVFAMTSLVELHADDNAIDDVAGIDALTDLRELRLRNNRLTSVPSSIAALQELRVLDLRGNPLQSLPPSLASLPHLYKLDLRWTGIPDADVLDELVAHGVLIYR